MEIKVPKHKPRIVQKEQVPDQRIVSVVPIRAVGDRTLTAAQYRVLLAFSSYANKGGVTWVGLDRIGKDTGTSATRAGVITRQLISKGYIRVLRKGYPGDRAQTRQVVYTDKSLEEIVAITGEKPRFMIEQERRAMEKEQQNQQVKPYKGKPRGRPRKIVRPADDLVQRQSIGTSADCSTNEDIQQLLSRIDPTLQLALKQQLPANATLEQYQSALDRMLR